MPAHVQPMVGLRALAAAIVLCASLSGCLMVENPPSAALACDPALVGDWGLVKGEGILGSSTRASEDSDFTADDERRLRIDAQCRAYLPPKFEPRQITLRVYKADGHRYLGLDFADVSVLLTGKKGEEELARNQALKDYPNLVSLLRYEATPESLSIDGGDMDQLKRIVQERDAKTPVPQADRRDWLTGDAKQIRRQLRARAELFSLPDGDTVYRFKRISPVAR
jgi:hypothetical protein